MPENIIINVNENNISQYPPTCFLNPKNERYIIKKEWLKNAKEAQNAPSIYASFNLIYNRELLADHYISNKRFEYIINKKIEKLF